MTPRYFYVSAIDGRKKHIVAGPYMTHKKALAMVDPVMRYANDLDGRAWFMAWGTAGSEERLPAPLGMFEP